MAPTVGKPTRRSVSVEECGWTATCWDLARLGWTVDDPCGSCALAATTRRDGHAQATENPVVRPAQLVTGDELERLLSQECDAPRDSTTS
jgi:hypothetical protein